MDRKTKDSIRQAAESGRITALTGAGISAESGIPTFRGPEGYWTVGSKEYTPQEIGTYSMFLRSPDQVWRWYLYRRGVCRKAQPNPGHLAICRMETLLQDRFTLITQNVDGLHLRAGNSMERTFQIHGNIDFMRCSRECCQDIFPIPEEIVLHSREEELKKEWTALLRCPGCKEMSRPHILWWDEMYNEHHFRFHSSIRAAEETDLLLVVGTSGATNLPNQVVAMVIAKGAVVMDINIEENRFTQMAIQSGKGAFLQGPGASILPEVLLAMEG